ncbi:hypothetical protein VPH219E481_0051 [Vibrio phage 219E48-1]
MDKIMSPEAGISLGAFFYFFYLYTLAHMSMYVYALLTPTRSISI